MLPEQHGEEAHGVEEGGDVGHAERPGPEQGQVEDGLLVAAGPTEEGQAQHAPAPAKRPTTAAD